MLETRKYIIAPIYRATNRQNNRVQNDWIQLFFKPEGGKFTYQVGNFEFTAHGESVDGADKGPVYTNHSVTMTMKTKKPGTLYAMSLCNIHGLWENSKPLRIK